MIPVRSGYNEESYKLFEDYNEFHLFVEDIGFEVLYEVILASHGVKNAKVFSKNGKTDVLNEAQLNNDPRCIFLIDADWDALTGKHKDVPDNVIRLDRHSIENYLIDFESFQNLLVDENPKAAKLTHDDFSLVLENVSNRLKPLFVTFVTMQMQHKPKKNCTYKPDKFATNGKSKKPDETKITEFINDNVQATEEVIDYFERNSMLHVGHGKFMLRFVWWGLLAHVSCSPIKDDSLKVRLARHNKSDAVADLVARIRKRAKVFARETGPL